MVSQPHRVFGEIITIEPEFKGDFMSLDKAIEHGKEKRKPYKGAKAIDCTCRNHGSCEWCKSNRLYQQLKMDEASRQALEELENGNV